MPNQPDYNIHLDVKYGPGELLDIPGLAAQVKEKWFNQTLCQVNDCVVRLGVIQGEFHWHKHDREDEFFYVVEGLLHIDLEDRTATLSPGQGLLIARGVRHRTRAPERTVILMIEGATVQPTGD